MIHQVRHILQFYNFTGRFLVKATDFKCSSCHLRTKATIQNYIFSGFWPGSLAENITYLFSEEVMLLRHHIAHKSPGCSDNMYVHSLEEVSKEYGRVRNTAS